jgi:hypothetical protein
MRSYDSRPITLDPGLTALALRALKNHEGQYPFVDKRVRRKGPGRRRQDEGKGARARGGGAAYLLIVGREHTALLRALKGALGGAPQLFQVIPDRRAGERRRGAGVAGGAAPPERRRRERRRRPPAAWQLLGFLVAPARSRPATPATPGTLGRTSPGPG